jgi:hypothetical protein
MARAVHCDFAGLLLIDQYDCSPQERNFSCIASIQGRCLAQFEGLDVPGTIPVSLTYYNTFGVTFHLGAVVYCNGSLTVTDQDTENPWLSLKADSLIRYAIFYLCLHDTDIVL